MSLLKNKKQLWLIPAGLVVLSLVIFVAYVNRFGIDLSDESFYAIGYAFRIEPVVTTLQFHLLYNKTVGFLNLGLLDIRHLRLFGHLLSSLVLASGILSFLKSTQTNRNVIILELFFISAIGSFVTYTFSPLTLSYNSLSSMLLNASIGVWLLGICTTSKKRSFYSYGVLLGFIICLAGYNKIPNGILLLIALPAFDVLLILLKLNLPNLSWKTLIHKYLMVGLGGVISVLVFTNYELGIWESIAQFANSLSYRDDSYSFGNLLEIYRENHSFVFENTIGSIGILIGIQILLKIAQRKLNFKYSAIVILIATLIVCWLFANENKSYIGGLYKKYSIFEIYYLLYFTLLSFWLFFSEKKKAIVFLILALFTVPFIGILGTNNGLSAQILFYTSFVLLSYLLFVRTESHWFRSALFSGIGILVLFQIYYATTEYTYRQSKVDFSLMENFEFTEFLSGIRTNPEMKTLQKDLSILNEKGITNFFHFSTEGGIALLTEIEPIPYGWLRPGEEKYACFIVSQNTFRQPESFAFVIPNTATIGSELNTCLQEKGINFYEDFVKVHEVTHFNYAYNKKQTLVIYMHKKNPAL